MSSKRALARPFRLKRQIPSRLSDVDDLCCEIRCALNENGFGCVSFAVELTARECLNNAVLHGNGGDPGKQVFLDLSCTVRGVRVHVTDEGPGFDWRKVLVRGLPDGTARSGRGLAIVGRYSDRFIFNAKGNRITLWLQPQRNSQKE